MNLSDEYEQIIYDTVQPVMLEPNLEELNVIINSLKNNKSPGEDKIYSELPSGTKTSKQILHLIV